MLVATRATCGTWRGTTRRRASLMRQPMPVLCRLVLCRLLTVAATLRDLAAVHREAGRLDEARRLAERAKEQVERLPPMSRWRPASSSNSPA